MIADDGKCPEESGKETDAIRNTGAEPEKETDQQ